MIDARPGAAAPPASASATPVPGGAFSEWERNARWFHLALVAALAIQVLALMAEDSAPRDRAIALVCVAAIGVAYWLWGVPAMQLDGTALQQWLYLGVLLAALLVAMRFSGSSQLLLMVGFTHCWMVAGRRREAIGFVTVLAVGTMLVLWARAGWETDRLGPLLSNLGITFLFTIGLGLFISHTMHQSEENARLLAELRGAQAELAASQHAAGVTAERERVAREIHDTLAQGFMSVVTQSQVVAAAIGRDDDAARERLGLIESTARENLAEARGLVAAFAPAPLADRSLTEALQRLGERWSAETGLRAVVEADDVGTLDAAREVVLLRAAQEALTNVRRHAGASAVWVTLDGGGHEPVRLEVIDDGAGIAPGTPEGYGLRGMRERVESAGGVLHVVAGDDGGTVLTATLPAPAPALSAAKEA